MGTHHTEQAARGYLMYRLALLGYTVQFTDSRFPKEDLLVVSPGGSHFGIDVKGNRTPNFWQYGHKAPHPQYFLALVYVPPKKPARCFILRSDTAMALRQRHIDGARARGTDHGRWGINWGDAHPFEDDFGILPA